MPIESMSDALMRAISAAFPEVEAALASLPPEHITLRLEEFSALTTLAFSTRQSGGGAARGKAYLAFMNQRLASATPVERDLIDTYFVEPLFWNAPQSTIERGWPEVPDPLKQLYLAFHGRPPRPGPNE